MSKDIGVSVNEHHSSPTSGLARPPDPSLAMTSVDPADLPDWAGSHVATWGKSLVTLFGNDQAESGLSAPCF